MSQQYSYPDDPGYRPPEQSGYPDQPVNYELEPRPGYDPTSAVPVMGGPTPQPQQPGYDVSPGTGAMPVTGPPQQPGYGPPAVPPTKSSSGMIIGIGVGVIVLMLVAGAVLWFFMLRGGEDPGGGSDTAGADRAAVFPESYTSTEAPPASDSSWGMDEKVTYDNCENVNLEPVKSVLPFDGNPKGDTKPNDDGTGRVSCEANLIGKPNAENNRPTGTFYVDFDAAKDSDEAEKNYDTIWDGAEDYGDAKTLDIGEEAESRTYLENNVRAVAIAYRFGNVTGVARISLNFSTDFKEPDQEMLTNVLKDVVYSGLNG